jgi:hypothetical protein
MIYCVWYPAGGFGHYVNAVLSNYGQGFAKSKNLPTFADNGNSHLVDLVAPKYYHDPASYQFKFDPNLNYSVLIDNGIDNKGITFKKFFPKAKIIKVCYSDFTWPVVANTMIVKGMHKSLDSVLLDDEKEPWAQREKYFLFLRDHSLRSAWKPDVVAQTLMIDDLMDYDTMRQSIGVELENFESFYHAWWHANKQYFLPVLVAQKILQGQFEPVDDIWTQAIVYYQIWCKYGIEVPHNNYSNWFESYEHIVTMLDDHGVKI